MKKNELAAAVAENAGLSKVEANKAIEAVFDVITEEVKRGGDVTVGGFGTFKSKTSKAREGRNPATGEPIQIPSKTSLQLRPAMALRDIK